MGFEPLTLNADFGGDPVGAGHWAVCGEAEPPAPAGCHDGPVWRPPVQVQSHLQVLLTHKPAPRITTTDLACRATPLPIH